MPTVLTLFAFQGPVSRRQYLAAGLGLAVVKYLGECLVSLAFVGDVWDPRNYLSPLITTRSGGGALLVDAPGIMLVLLGLWTVPFLWIATVMSARRAADAGCSPWAGLALLLPFVNYVAIALLASLPRRTHPAPPDRGQGVPLPVRAALGGIALVATAGVGLIAVLTEGLQHYGLALFFSLPFLLGTATGYLYNLTGPRSAGDTVAVVCLTLFLGALMLLLLAFEGLICLMMAGPIVLATAIPGALFGRVLARASLRPGSSSAALAVLLPVLGALERELPAPLEREVVTTVEIDVPPEQVWPHVVSFAELPAPTHWVFATGLAYPLRARIEGEGVGAVRHCEFTTGAFVEPITRWEPPHRLSFDVAAQPEPMEEWSFYAKLHPPHLSESFQSRRGEFRLVALPGGRTRLEGSTWYTLDMAPEGYWNLWGDAILHRIHRRVLEHVKARAEGPEK